MIDTSFEINKVRPVRACLFCIYSALGRESYAVVEFAPFQKIPPPKERIKVDQRNGTIEKGEWQTSKIELLDTRYLQMKTINHSCDLWRSPQHRSLLLWYLVGVPVFSPRASLIS